ncbi:MAG: hypothetical protein KJN99_02915, partial [Marinicaulis sp.]|nr:hypothetical protein [Marinicaulis sp.]
ETYVDPCPVPDGVIVESALVDRIFAHPELAQSLREWVSLARIVGQTLTDQQLESGTRIIATINSAEDRN